MNKAQLSVYMGVALLIICVCDVISTQDQTLTRQKRGFRLNSASRVAHGYGKRGGFMPPTPSERLSQFPLGPLENVQDITDDNEGMIMSVNQFAQLLASHPNLARALVKKFVDYDGDDVISSEELFRPVMRK